MADEKRSFEQVTLKGVGNYFYVNSQVSEYEGKTLGYSFNLMLTPEMEKRVKEVASKILTVAQNPEWLDSRGRKVPSGKWLPIDYLIGNFIKTDKEGKKFIKLKAKHEISQPDGSKKRVYIPIFDTHGRLPDEEANNISLYSGSEVAVEFVLYAFYTPTAQGVTSKIKSIQVIKAVQSGGTEVGATFKFEKPNADEEVPI